MRRTVLVVALLLAAAGAVAAAPVGAHEEVPGIRNELRSVEPPLPDGVSVQVLISAADQLVVANGTDDVLEVPGADGEPFLRIGPGGVEANFRSPTWHRTLNPDEGGALPPEADAAAPPRFVRVSREPTWGWFDHRLHAVPVRSAPPAGPGETVVLEEWSIPLRIAGSEHVVEGARVFSRPTGAFVPAIRSAPEELEATLLGGLVPAIALTRTGDATIEVLGPDGRVFARVGAEVLVDRSSPLWRLTESVRSSGDPPDSTEDEGAAEGSLVPYEGGGQLVWLEPRAVYQSETPPEGISDTEPTVVHEWQVPVRVGDRRDAIRGVTSWVPAAFTGAVALEGPADDEGRAPSWLAPVAVGVTAAVVALVVRRRRDRKIRTTL